MSPLSFVNSQIRVIFALIMINIESHIENLLLSHDCVIVPGIGGFVTRYEGSYIEGQDIYPPFRSISFNSQLKENDGLLAQSYMTAYDTSYPKAQSLVEENVKEIRNQLHENGFYDFKNIGKLQLAQNQSLIFTPTNDLGIFSKDHYGLSNCNIDLEAFANMANFVENSQVDNAPNSNTSKPFEISRSSKQKIFNTDADNSHYVIRISKNYVRNTVAVVAAAILYFIFTIAPSANPIEPSVQEAAFISTNATPTVCHKPVPTPKSQPAKPVATVQDSALKQPDTQTTTKITDQETKSRQEALTGENMQKDQQTTPVAKTTQKVQASPKETYTIVIASAISQQGGETLVESLKKEKLTEAKFIRDGKMNRVVYSSFSSQKEAFDALNKLRTTNENFSSAWVLKR